MSEKEVTPSLHDTLQALAALIPERVRLVTDDFRIRESWYARLGPNESPKVEKLCAVRAAGDTTLHLMQGGAYLEYALREEIEERGWGWRAGRVIFAADGEYVAAVQPYGAMADKKVGYGSSPALALSLALLAALNGQK